MIDRSDRHWYKNAVIYELHIKAFFDANNDGVGDFAGLYQKLDYLQDLGITAIWLLPFYPSPLRDDGYDIADYTAINPTYGTMRDFRQFVAAAHARGMRVITELVVNHTSDQHPWFQRARYARADSKWRDYYVWSDSDAKYPGTRIIFLDTEKSNWTWDPVAQAYFWHRFYSHQPDLNYDNPRVLVDIMRAMRFWLDLGVDGLRLDAVPYLIEREGTNNENLPETHEILKRFRAELDQRYPDRMLLAEANQWPEDTRPYFGRGDECHMAFHFPLMPRIYMGLAREDRYPITDIITQTPPIPENCQWAIFLRNHDELTLEMVTDSERDYLWQTYATDQRARLNLGIRRRLAPLLDNDRRKIELLNGLLLSMPGTPVIYYGDELGMGDNFYLGDRNGVRTPMQWTPDRNGGFSRADPAQLYLPSIMDPVYGYSAVNVEAQARSLSSLLNWTKRLISVRKSTKVFGRGTLTFIRPANRSVLAYVRQLGDEAILCVANISRSAQAVELDLNAWKGRIPQEMLGRTRFPRIGDLPYLVTLPPYGFFWFLLQPETEKEPEKILPREITTLVLGHGWESSVSGWTRRTFEVDVLPSFMPDRRWFADKASRTLSTKVAAAVPMEHGDDRFGLVIAEVDGQDGPSRYLLPLTIRWTRYTAIDRGPASVLAAVRRGAREGTLLDAVAEPEFARALLAKIHESADATSGAHRIEFRPTAAFADAPLPEIKTINDSEREQSNSTVTVDNHYVIKILRRVMPGIHPEIEIGRFLTDVAHFQNAPALLGTVELVEGDSRSALAVVHAFVENQGDAWTVTSASLDRLVDEQRLLPTEAVAESPDTAFLLHRMRQIGKRTAEMHVAFASHPEDPAFAPEPITREDVAAWTSSMTSRAKVMFALLERSLRDLPEAAAHLARQLLAHGEAIMAHVESVRDARFDGVKIRQHGDFHLGQVLIAKDDAFIRSFEGEPRRTLEDRRRKAPPARDVAGFVRSIDYAVSAAVDREPNLNAEERATLNGHIRAWGERLTTTYWESYRETISSSGLWPTEDNQALQLLNAFLLEKVLGEIENELANRPEWAHIPLAAALRICSNAG